MADEQHSLQTYVSDMLALERHISNPLKTQAGDDDIQRFARARMLVDEVLSATQSHISALERELEILGGHAASPVKSAVAGFEGMVAGAIDKMRKTKVTKALRDDYTALALCTAGYTLLQATALALGNQSIATLAESHLRDYASLVMKIGNALPSLVISELADIGLDVNDSVVQPATEAAQSAWRGGAKDSYASERGTIESSVISPA